MQIDDVLRSCITELKQMHSHHEPSCQNGGPTLLAIRQAEALLGDKPLTWSEWMEGYNLSLSEFVPVGAEVDEEIVSQISGVTLEDLRNPTFQGVPGNEQQRYITFPSDVAGDVRCGFLREAFGGPWYFTGAMSSVFEARMVRL